jgi:20S proteasome alpha/beta subunit
MTAPAAAPSTGRFGGTFIAVIVTQDGILVGSDSRSTFVTSTGKPVGYVDQMPKIYVNQGTAVAVAGLTSVEDELFSSFIRRNDYLLASSVSEILYDVALKLPFRNTTNVLLLSAGFVDDEPTICAKAPIEPQSCRKSGYFSNKESASLRRWYLSRNGETATTAEAARALQQAIREAADLDPTIGGPITLLFVPKFGTSRWLQNPPSDHGWTRVCDVVTDYRAGKARIFFTDTKEELDRYLGGICPR